MQGAQAVQCLFIHTRNHKKCLPDRVAQSVTCLTKDTRLTANLRVASSITARSHTFVEIDHEIMSTAILLPSTGFQLQAKVCARGT